MGLSGLTAVLEISFTIVCVLGIVFVIGIARSTRGDGPTLATDQAALGEREKTWFAVVVVLLVSVLVATIFFTPYGRSAGSDAQVVEVQGLQFAWIVPNTPIKAGRQVEFVITSKDVNHSFAVYNSAGTMLFQTQVMPGYTTKYVYTFHKPGTYHVLCLEYCGVGHANMQADLKVEA